MLLVLCTALTHTHTKAYLYVRICPLTLVHAAMKGSLPARQSCLAFMAPALERAKRLGCELVLGKCCHLLWVKLGAVEQGYETAISL